MTKKYIIYHDHCLDGLMSAVIFKKYIDKHLFQDENNYSFIPGSYNKSYNDYPDMSDGIVYFLDFCFKEQCFQKLLEVVQRCIVIDHHKSALEMLTKYKDHNKVVLKVDMNHCGCVLTYNYLYPDPKEHCQTTITLLEHIEDVDIWLHRKKESKYIVLALSQNLTLQYLLNFYYNVLEDDAHFNYLIHKGRILHTQLKSIADIEYENSFVRNVGYFGDIRFINNTCKLTQSIHCHYCLDSGLDETLIFFSYSGDGVSFSIRSKGKIDCTQVAKFIDKNGGGHVKASGAMINNTYPLLLQVHPILRIIQDPSYKIRITRKQEGV